MYKLSPIHVPFWDRDFWACASLGRVSSDLEAWGGLLLIRCWSETLSEIPTQEVVAFEWDES